MKLLITGGKGMLGRTLQRVLSRHTLFVADLPEVDITRFDSIERVCRAFQPDAILHCAAMTRVDDCETAEEAAFRVNGKGAENVALAASTRGARLIAISTDYVFDGGVSAPRTAHRHFVSGESGARRRRVPGDAGLARHPVTFFNNKKVNQRSLC